MSREKIEKRLKRKKRVRSKMFGTHERPRLSVFRSNNHVFVQLVDDISSSTLVSASDMELKKGGKNSDELTKKNISFKVGEMLAEKASAKKIKKVVFDRNGYRYHGRIKDLAEGARKGGLEL